MVAASSPSVWGQAAPAGCIFPTGYDNLFALTSRSNLTEGIINRWQCILNALQQRALYEGTRETVCADVSVPPGKRVLQVLTLSSAPGLQAPIFTSVSDAINPSRLEVSSTQAAGSSLNCWVFNHDPNGTRSGRVCAQVVHL